MNYYNLSEQPFGVTPDSRFLHLGPAHREALASLLYGTESNRGFIALIARPGMGKTTLLYHYLSYLRGKARTAFVFRTDCDSRDFIRHVLLDLGIDSPQMDLPAMHETLNRVLTEEMHAGRRFVLVVDEAQNLGEKVLESIRLLSNFETPSSKLMQIVLAGQPQLADRLSSPSMSQLRQRISMVIPIEPLTPGQVNAYIDHRLWIAGNDKRPIFSAAARNLIAERSEGIPRNINNLCFHAMSAGCALRRPVIDRDIIAGVIADLDLERLRANPIPPTLPPAETVANLSAVSLPAKKSSRLGRLAARFTVAAVFLLLLGWPILRVSRGVQPLAPSRLAPPPTLSVPAVSTAAAPSISIAPPEKPAARVSSSANEQLASLRVKPGQTLYQISVQHLGRYDHGALSQFQQLNPWLTNPDHIRSGRMILIPSPAAIPGDNQRVAEQSSNVSPAEADKP
ncbi:MAG TPA: AAA family ATPase [Verrucomicrobiae bacterium]|nr:AAA family ATPase [Verrucomicrobiae bacterium]